MTHACRVCGEDFEPSAAAVRNGIWICRACLAAENRAYRAAHLEEEKERGRAYRATPRGKEQYRAYRAANPEKEKERHRAYQASPTGKAVHRKVAAKRRAKYPDRAAAHSAVSHAIASGRLVRQNCENCPSTEKAQGHHEDYSKPLDVIWLCKTCHDDLHACKRG